MTVDGTGRAGDAPVQLLKAEAAGVVVVDLLYSILQHLPGFLWYRHTESAGMSRESVWM